MVLVIDQSDSLSSQHREDDEKAVGKKAAWQQQQGKKRDEVEQESEGREIQECAEGWADRDKTRPPCALIRRERKMCGMRMGLNIINRCGLKRKAAGQEENEGADAEEEEKGGCDGGRGC